MRIQRSVISFLHIEKAAGQTFISILENNFPFTHCRVKPYKKNHNGVFTAEAMKMVLRINPFAKSISGHSIVPFSDLENIVPNIRHITILREPIARYFSHYFYQVNKMNRFLDFKEFLSDVDMMNFQTRKIAGKSDVEEAKELLKNRFFLVGIVEEFDDFLHILKQKLLPLNFRVEYYPKNVGRHADNYRYLKHYKKVYLDQIIENNKLDLELYQFVKNEVLKREKQIFVKNCHCSINHRSSERLGIGYYGLKYGSIFFRNCYYGPIIMLLRRIHGLAPRGSY